MSSKTKTTETKGEAKPMLVPMLRFPEFRWAEEWDVEALGNVASFVNEKIPLERVAVENYVSTENILPDYGGVAKASKLPTKGSVTRYRPSDTLVSNIRPYLKKVWVADKEGGASNDVIVISAKQRLHPEYLSCLLKNDAFIDYVMTGAKGVKMPRGDVASMKAYPTLYPSKAEQQKIADCLGSVDRLIAAQGRKVDALKTYKKGLMQQIFPREGETQPILRFPEFQDAGEWEEKPLGKVAENLDNRRVPITASQREAGVVPYYGASGAVDFVKGFIFDEDLLCVSEDGANLVARTYPIAFHISGKTWVNNHAHVLRFENPCTQKFVEVYLNSIKLDDFITGMAQPKLNKAMLDSIPIPHPDVSEQQHIADCLTSLDDLITAQSAKLEVLKSHKTGLMQQLFPSAAEVDA
jgi:type I restriction enzyme S subunit